jgi:hypothetical protein
MRVFELVKQIFKSTYFAILKAGKESKHLGMNQTNSLKTYRVQQKIYFDHLIIIIFLVLLFWVPGYSLGFDALRVPGNKAFNVKIL